MVPEIPLQKAIRQQYQKGNASSLPGLPGRFEVI